MGRNTESRLRERADRREHMLDMQSPRPGQGSRVRHRRLRTKRPGRWRRKPETFCIGLETAGPDCAARASPTRLSTRMAVALSSRGKNARDGLGHALDGVSSTDLARSIREEAKIDARGDVVRDAFKQRRQGQRPPTRGSEADLAFGSGRRGQCATAIPENPSRLALLRRPQRNPSPAHVPRLCAA